MTFLNPLFLLGLLAVSIPLVIHLLSRRTTRRVDFSNLEFLRNLERKSMRRVRVRQLLLLLVRMALIAALAFAMARPTLTGLAGGDAGGSTSAVIVLDASWSMGARAGEEIQFETARDRAREIIGTFADGDEVYLFAPGGHGTSERSEALRDLGLVRERLEAVEVGRRAVDLAASLREAVAQLDEARYPNREVHVVSDFQRSAIELDEAEALPENVRVFFHPIGEQAPPNAWIDSVDFSGQILERGSPVEFRAVVAAGPGFPASEVEVELEVDGRVADRRRIDLGPAGRVPLTFRETLRNDGLHTGTVQLRGADGAPEDDRRYFTFRAEKEIPVLVVCPDERIRRYLVTALAPQAETAGVFSVRQGSVDDLRSASREREAVIVVADVERFAERELAGLKAFLSEGGGLLVFPGPRTDATAWGRTLLPKFIPGSFATVLTGDEPFGFAARQDPHPLFAVFEGGDRGIPEVRFTRALRFRPQAGTAVLASYENGAPALVESSLLPGRALMFTSSLDPNWSDLPLTGAYLPLLHESVRYLSETGSRTARQLEVGEGATIWTSVVPDGGGVTLIAPDGRERAVPPEPGPGGYALKLDEADEPGFWTFRTAAGDTIASFAASVPRAESDPTRADAAELEHRLDGLRGGVLTAGPGLGAQVREARVGREIGRYFLWAAALLMLLEMFLASRLRGAGDEA